MALQGQTISQLLHHLVQFEQSFLIYTAVSPFNTSELQEQTVMHNPHPSHLFLSITGVFPDSILYNTLFQF